MNFQDKIDTISTSHNSLVCIGLDPVLEKLPKYTQTLNYPFFAFNKAIIEATAEYVCAYKPNSAFYEALGSKGIEELKMTCDYLHNTYPEIPIILDAKRGDIGSTNEGYVQYAFDYLQADAVTVQPYLGNEAMKPFLDRVEKGIIILCRTSNPGSGELQNLTVQSIPLYQHVAEKVMTNWNYNNNCMLVIGATYPEELKEIRSIVGDMNLLIPGIGAQGGDIEKTVRVGLNSKKRGLIISASRSIIFASQEEDFAEKAKEETIKLRHMINHYR